MKVDGRFLKLSHLASWLAFLLNRVALHLRMVNLFPFKVDCKFLPAFFGSKETKLVFQNLLEEDARWSWVSSPNLILMAQ